MAKNTAKPSSERTKPASANRPNSPASAPAVKPGVAVPPSASVGPAGWRLFTPEDWIAAGLTFLLSGAAYLYYMSPSVTLEDSGELVTGAFNLGVPHPPGYPLWAFLGWVWRHMVPFGNPAWRICLMSVLTGALVVGVLTLLMTRSIMMLLRASPWDGQIEERMKHWIALTVGASSALLFGFNRGVWLWACVPEMRVLNVFMFTLTACLFFAWAMRPERQVFLYVTTLVYGLGIANHQTIAVMAAPIMVGAFMVGLQGLLEARPNSLRATDLMKALKPFWELVAAALLSAAAGFLFWAWLETTSADKFFDDVWWWRAVAAAAAGVLILIAFGILRWLDRRRALICTAAFLLGCGFYAYMPISSATNPPMNWGYTATKAGFLHQITRGQYERLNFAKPLSREFFIQIDLFTHALKHQYSMPLCLIALVTLVSLIGLWKRLKPRARSWLIFVWAAFLTTSLGLLTIINPALDKQNQEITSKFFAPAHGFFAMLIGYGIALMIGAALARWDKLPRNLVRVGCALLLALPAIPFYRNWSICEQHGHDFGYQFGYRMFYPGGDYPPMDRDTVLFGGTDPGRFVPTYMIFCESLVRPGARLSDPNLDPEGGKRFDRRDVYIITQNALADTTYMSYIRDHYDYSRPDPRNPASLANREPWQRWLIQFGWNQLGRSTTYPREPIYIPTDQDTQLAFKQYVQDVQARQARGQALGPDEQVEVDPSGRVSIKGVVGVMGINGILTNWIFERNKDKHAFYVEESYVIPWMYSYLTPYGIIMKINHDPVPSPEQNPALWKEIVARDTAYWNKLISDFRNRPEFRRDTDAQKTFSKLRSAIGGIYAWRHMGKEADYALQQAHDLCPDSPDANSRLLQRYMEEGRFNEAAALVKEWHELDPLNSKITQSEQQVKAVQQQAIEIQAVEQRRQLAPADVSLVIQLAQMYAKMGQAGKIQPMLQSYLTQTNVTANDMLQVAQIYLNVNLVDQSAATIQQIVQRFPKDSNGYFALALIRAHQSQGDEALNALEKAIQLNPQLRETAAKDKRFDNLRVLPRFQRLVGAAPPA